MCGMNDLCQARTSPIMTTCVFLLQVSLTNSVLEHKHIYKSTVLTYKVEVL